jgi:hypothetical protein
VYVSAVVEELVGAGLERCLEIDNGRFPDPARHGVQIFDPEDILRGQNVVFVLVTNIPGIVNLVNVDLRIISSH